MILRLFVPFLALWTTLAKNVRRRADKLDELNLGRGELHLPTNDGVISCYRTFTEDGGWYGECDGGSDANFVQRNDGGNTTVATFGSYHTAGKVCRMTPDADGIPTVQCLNEDELEDEDVDIDVDDDEYDDEETHERKLASLNVSFAMDHVSDLSERRRLYDDSGSTLDLLVVWTPLAECVNSGMQRGCKLTAQTEANMRGLIDLALVETNVAFSLSNIRTKLRIVHAYRDDSYDEPPAPKIWNQMLVHLTQAADGNLDSVHTKRVLYGADLVHMIAGSGGSCGVAHVGPKKSKSFSISRTSCATGYYSFGHEIGHNIGAHHDRPSLNRCDSHENAFNFGYRDTEAEFRTILAYGCRSTQCDNLPKNGCQRIQRFSNGVTTYNGKKLGNAANNNARTINEASKWVAQYFPAMDCLADSECNDNDVNTVDTCNVEQRVCVFTPRAELSGAMESVVVEAVDDKGWKTVSLKNSYKKPVIACTVKYHKDNMIPVVVRMTDVTDRSFKVLLQNPRYLGSTDRQVHCLIVEEGVWKLPDGRKVEAKRTMSQRTDSSVSWVGTQQTYQHTYSSDPVVLGQVMSYNDSKWSTFWARGKNRWLAPDITHLFVGQHVGEDSQKSRLPEEIGYICMERGRASVSPNYVVESDRSSIQPMGYVSNQWVSPFKAPFAQPPAATIATQAGMEGGDGSWVILTSDATTAGFGIAMDEDQVMDNERMHAKEQVNYVAVSSLAPIRLVQS